MTLPIFFGSWFLLAVFGFIVNLIIFKKTFAGVDEYNLWIDQNSQVLDGLAILFFTTITPFLYLFIIINLYDIYIGKGNNLIQVVFKVKIK